MIIAGTMAYTITNLGFIIYALVVGSGLWLNFLLSLLVLWGSIHIFLMLYAVVQLCAEQKHLRHTFWSATKVVLFNPFFTWLFVPHAIKALTSKHITWAPIEHGTKNTILEAKNEKK